MARSDLPAGTVTFLFTDIEGSTRLLHDLGPDGYAEALARHRLVLRDAFARHGGVEVDTQGDAFFVAFPTAPGALEAAHEAQDALSVPVRMGVHTGTPLLTDEGYVGSDVHRAARIAAAGHGRQVLVSAATAALVDGAQLRDLGEHRLKDLSAPERIYQLGEAEFARLKTLYQTNLPVPATPFLGRERELAEVAELVDGARLLTLIGPGGTGKTRLALQAAGHAAERYPDGVFWVSLAPLRDPALVLEQAGRAVGSKNGLEGHVADKRLLLLLDNFEHLMGAANDLAQLLASCPNLSVLVTSRELLHLEAEQAYAVPPLDAGDGVELFSARARAADPSYSPTAAVEELCAKLDHLPLALELAAARLRVLSPEQLLERLAARLDLLKGGRDADPRQQTLRATIAWSYDLLDGDERDLFARFAVFRGGCRIEAAEEVARATVDTLQSLVDKSLVRRTAGRFWMLETIREYARERVVESGAEVDLRLRHAMHYLDLAELAQRKGDVGGSEQEWLDLIAADVDNVRGALEWARDGGEEEILVRLVASMIDFWGVRGLFRERRDWLAIALEQTSAPSAARMKVVQSAAWDALNDDADFARAEALTAELRRVAEQAQDTLFIMRSMNLAARTAGLKGDLEGQHRGFLALRDKAAEIGDRGFEGGMLINLATTAMEAGAFPAAFEYASAAQEIFRELDSDSGAIVGNVTKGLSALGLGDAALAEELAREAAATAARMPAIHRLSEAVELLGTAYVTQNAEERGTELLGAADGIRDEIGTALSGSPEEQFHERAVAEARAALGEEAFVEAWERGRAMTLEEIVESLRPS